MLTHILGNHGSDVAIHTGILLVCSIHVHPFERLLVDWAGNSLDQGHMIPTLHDLTHGQAKY
jgi:hypothetical protein